MRILVIEDETELAATLRRGLSAEGFTVDVAGDGRQGLQLASTEAYAAVILDLMLPGMNGFKVCEQLRAAGNDTPILVLSAKDGEYDQTDALDGGADDYLTKPFRYPVLLAHLRALLRRSGTDRSDKGILEVGDLRLDERRRRCWRGSTEIGLTTREFSLLSELAHRAGEVQTKRALLLQVWPEDSDDVNLVEVRISALRRKIDQPFGRDSLQTIRGSGYRLVDDR